MSRAVQSVYALRLEKIVQKLGIADATISRVWPEAEARRATQLYTNFLVLHVLHGDRMPPLAPTPTVDEIWHHHILDTRQYQVDCAAIFGAMFHHDPYVGRIDKPSADALKERDMVCALLPLIEFGQTLE
jgi:hypothetical protein